MARTGRFSRAGYVENWSVSWGILIPKDATATLLVGVQLNHEAAAVESRKRPVSSRIPWSFIGGVYINSYDSIVTWWTTAEDLNDMGDQHKNLYSSFVLISIAFFLALLRTGEKERDLFWILALGPLVVIPTRPTHIFLADV